MGHYKSHVTSAYFPNWPSIGLQCESDQIAILPTSLFEGNSNNLLYWWDEV